MSITRRARDRSFRNMPTNASPAAADTLLGTRASDGATVSLTLANLWGGMTAQANTWSAKQTININPASGSGSWDVVALKDAKMVRFRRFSNPSGPAWANGAYINSSGAWHTDAWITISGTHNGTPDGEGDYAILPPTSDPVMLGVWSDVDSAAMQVRGSSAGNTNQRLVDYLDPSGNYVLSVETTGQLTWGNSTRAGQDTWLKRGVGVGLQTNATFLQFPNNAALKWADSGGTARTVLQLDTGNNLYLGSASANVIRTIGPLYLQNKAQNATNVYFEDNGRVGFGVQSYGGGAGSVIAIANATTPPTVNVTGGGVMYVQAGALMFRGSSGTVTTVAPA